VWIQLLTQYWKYVLVLVVLLSLSASLVWMKISNIKLEADKKVFEGKLLSITLQLEQSAKEYKTAMSEYTNNIQKIKTVYQDRVKTIYNIQGDNNANDCNDTAFVLNSIEY
jgi:hypothetical protein